MSPHEVLFHYAVAEAGEPLWFPTAKETVAYINTHRTEGRVHVVAGSRYEARKLWTT